MNAEMSTTTKLPELNKRTVAVLTEPEMMEVNGGTTIVCVTAATAASSEVCATGAGASIVVLYKIWQSL